jgi:TPP-dependent pyruvate/acetoin dehydrogenase alpha subunit
MSSKEHETGDSAHREVLIQQALKDLYTKKYRSPNAAAVAYGINAKTLQDRWSGRRRDPVTAHEHQMLISRPEKEVLTVWCIHLSLIGQPLTRTTFGASIYKICGKKPSVSYIDKFISKNELLALRTPTSLDPK